MKNRIYLLLLTLFIINGCSSSDLQNSIDDALGKDDDQVSTIDQATDEANGLNRHNEIRAEVFTGSALAWSDQVAADAQSYANTLAANGKFEHDGASYSNGPYGENLYASLQPSGAIVTYEEAVESWYVEKDFYDYANNSCSVDESNTITVDNLEYNTCGHYTQIVWKDTNYVGCARAKYTAGDLKDGYVIVCKYKIQGNIAGNTPY